MNSDAEPEVTFQIQYRAKSMASYNIHGDNPWVFSSMWDTEQEAQRRCYELENQYSHFEWRPVKITVEVVEKL